MTSERETLRHFLAAIAYRAQKALRGAPTDFPDFSAGNRSRTPVQTLRHMTSVLGYARTHFNGGSYPVTPEPLPSFSDEVQRFHSVVEQLGTDLSSDLPLKDISERQLLQGPLADAMTHVGQLALLRRLFGSPVPPENFVFAAVDPARLGADQAMPARPDANWPEG